MKLIKLFLFLVVVNSTHILLANHSTDKLFKIIKKNDVDEAEKILQDKPDLIKCLNANGSATALHKASQQQRSSTMLTFLVGEGAPINILNKKEQTALHLAAELGHLSVVRRLLNLGANTSLKDLSGHTAYEGALLSKKEGAQDCAHEIEAYCKLTGQIFCS